MSLATTDQFQAITGTTLDGPGLTRAQVLLDLASDAVLANAHGQNITSQTYEDATLYQQEGVFYFPQRPVTAVASVTVGGELVDPSMYRWEAGGPMQGRRPARLIRRILGHDTFWGYAAGLGHWFFNGDVEATVTYTAGWDPVPGQIVGAVVAMANAVFSNGADPLMSLERIEGWEGKLDMTDAQYPDLSITAHTQSILDQLCGTNTPTYVPLVGTTTGVHRMDRAQSSDELW